MLAGFADEHVHAAIVAALRRRGMDVVTVQDAGLEGADDESLLQRATAEYRLMLTQDTDFLRLHAEWLGAGRSHAGIVFWHADGTSIGEVVRLVLDYAVNTTAAEAADHVKFL